MGRRTRAQILADREEYERTKRDNENQMWFGLRVAGVFTNLLETWKAKFNSDPTIRFEDSSELEEVKSFFIKHAMEVDSQPTKTKALRQTEKV